MKKFFTSLILLLPIAADANPIFPSSVTSNDIDFITPDDPSVFQCIQFDGRSRQEMPSKLRDGLFQENAYVFAAHFSDGTRVAFFLDEGFSDQSAAEIYAKHVAHRIGQLPTLMRAKVKHVVINLGDETASAEESGGFFMMYADNIDKRIATHDLSETVFHETVHVALQNEWINTNDWQDAIAADAGFITDYASTRPGEDMAESALFAYTYLRHPERLPPKVKRAIETTIPNRINVFDNIIIQWAPHTYQVNPTENCS